MERLVFAFRGGTLAHERTGRLLSSAIAEGTWWNVVVGDVVLGVKWP